MTDPNARAITVTAAATPPDCTHPAEARTTRTDRGSYDWVYEVCAQCASERSIHPDDDGCSICDTLDGPGHPWTPGAKSVNETAATADAAKPPSVPSCPNCGGMVCAECAALYGRTAIHVYSGRCSFGHAVPEVVAL